MVGMLITLNYLVFWGCCKDGYLGLDILYCKMRILNQSFPDEVGNGLGYSLKACFLKDIIPVSPDSSWRNK